MSNDEALAIVNSDGVKEDIPPTFALEFVNVGAVSQAERERNQKVIRSTAMRAFRRRQQSEKLLNEDRKCKVVASRPKTRHSRSKNSQSDGQGTSPIPNSDLSSEAPFSELSWLVGGSSNARKANYFAFIEGNRSSSSSSESSRAPSVVDSPISPLGAGRIDPFRTLSGDPGSHINELIDHSVTHLWPGLRPRRSNGSESKISSAWLEKVYERPVVMHALLFGAAVHMDVLRSPRLSLDNPIRLHHKVQTMRLLKEELKSPEKTPLDEVLLAVLCLASNEVETVANNMKEKIRPPFNSPLTNAQWLDVYGSITHIPAHTIAMRSLVNRRGGLERIELEGLADVIAFSDILGATQSLSKPYWPLLDQTRSSKLETPAPVVRKLGQGFQDLLSIGLNNQAASVLQEMANLTMIIEDHCRGSKFISNITVLIDHRNTVQHNLLSLPKGDELRHGDVSSVCLYDSIRYAAVIYSAAVTFPLPPLTGIFRRLASALKTVVDESKFEPCWKLCSKTLLWILVLGGIAATDAPERIWYVQKLSAMSSSLGFPVWDEVAEELGNYLWLESACDVGGRLLWTEVMNHRALQDVDDSENPAS